MNNQSLTKADNRSEPPNALSHEDLLSPSSMRYNPLEGVGNNVRLVFEGYSHSYTWRYLLVRCCRTKLIDSYVYNNRYRYHKNSIIDKDLLSLVGF